jgi:phospholipid/cholesterol/gamma-HCH transport system permease protein
MIAMPLLTVEAVAIGIIGGYVVCWTFLGIYAEYAWHNMVRYTDIQDVATGLIKTFVFGIIIALVSCYKGLNCKQGAEGVGHATTEAVVYSSITSLISNFFLTLALKRLIP